MGSRVGKKKKTQHRPLETFITIAGGVERERWKCRKMLNRTRSFKEFFLLAGMLTEQGGESLTRGMSDKMFPST